MLEMLQREHYVKALGCLEGFKISLSQPTGTHCGHIMSSQINYWEAHSAFAESSQEASNTIKKVILW
jgi:hypothetical protein